MMNQLLKQDLDTCEAKNAYTALAESLGQPSPWKQIGLRVIQPPLMWNMSALDFSPGAIADAIELGKHWREHQREAA